MKVFVSYLIIFVVSFGLGRFFGLHLPAAYEVAGALTAIVLLADWTISKVATADARIARQLFTGRSEAAVIIELGISPARFKSYSRRMVIGWYSASVRHIVKEQDASGKKSS